MYFGHRVGSANTGSVQPRPIGSTSTRTAINAQSPWIAVLRYVDPCPGLACRARRPFPAERRPKFISVTVWGARYGECSTPSNWFNLCGNCYKCSISMDSSSQIHRPSSLSAVSRETSASGGKVRPNAINSGAPFLWCDGRMTSLQKRTAETPSAQRVKKRTTRDAWRSIPVHDAIRKPPLRTPRRCGEIPFCSGLKNVIQHLGFYPQLSTICA
jgi:hypothetical protein